MDKKQRIRMAIDCMMTALSVVLMGGTVMFPDDRVHQILGMALLLLWVCHTILNRRWYASLFKGSYQPYRVMQLVVNLGISVCALLLMLSGVMMAWFLPFSVGAALGFARTAHLAGSHWYYLFMCAHIGLHVNVIFVRFRKQRPQTQVESHRARTVLLRALLALVCSYGIYAFIVRGLWKYMLLLQQFFFFDFERGYILFAVDYLAILVLFAAIAFYAGKALLLLGKKQSRDSSKKA